MGQEVSALLERLTGGKVSTIEVKTYEKPK